MAGGNLAPSARLFTCAGAEMQNNLLAQEQGPLIHNGNRENPVLLHIIISTTIFVPIPMQRMMPRHALTLSNILAKGHDILIPLLYQQQSNRLSDLGTCPSLIGSQETESSCCLVFCSGQLCHCMCPWVLHRKSVGQFQPVFQGGEN